ncbi:Major facilitator superfamily [Macrophomina phaseolina MS6]|uniref:Major facilitator superfamily n=1 Tax=Macrophomina phaseolina (strain MS6) TaxID=1126212 RepID=K2RIU5_MACPH|nr:Major facilitator superfamily [Macrophomina phaseolina MS6]
MEAEQDKTVSAELKGLPEAESQSCSSTSEPKEKESFQVPLVLTLSAANFLNTLTVQSSVIILPSIGRDIGIPAARQQWIISSYYMTYGCFLLLWGRIADLYGRRNVFIAGSIWVAASTIAVPFAKNEIAFDVLRGCTGLGAAANVSAGLGILGNAFEAGRAKNYAFSAFGGAHSLGTIMGILFGGVIAQYLSWEWVFWIFGIVASIVVVAGFFVIQPDGKAHASQERAGVDVLGGALITASLLLFTYALTEGEIGGWARPWIPVLLAVSVLLAVIFVLWQRHLELRTQRAPLLKMSIFNNKRFSAAQVILCLFYGAFNNFLLFATY